MALLPGSLRHRGLCLAVFFAKLLRTTFAAAFKEAKGYDLPRSLEEAIAELRACKPLRALLGERFVRAYTAVKDKEHQTYLRVISSWEREFLLLNV